MLKMPLSPVWENLANSLQGISTLPRYAADYAALAEEGMPYTKASHQVSASNSNILSFQQQAALPLDLLCAGCHS